MFKMMRSFEDSEAISSFLRLLIMFGEQANKIPNIKLQKLDFNNDQLRINIQADTFERLKDLNQALLALGLNVTQEKASTQDNKVEASLLLKRGG